MNKRLLIGGAVAVVACCLLGIGAIQPDTVFAPPEPSPEPARMPAQASQSVSTLAAAPVPLVRASAPAAAPSASGTALPLLSQAQMTLINRDGREALRLSRVIGFCKHEDEIADKVRAGFHESGQAIPPAMAKRWQDRQVQCQTVAGQTSELERQLLQLAKEQQIPSAAAHLWERSYKPGEPADSATRELILRDAFRGDVESLVIALGHAGLRVSSEDQEVLRRGIERASKQAPEYSMLGILSKTVAEMEFKNRSAFTADQLATIDQRAATLAAALLANAEK